VAELGRRPAHLPVTGEVVQVLEILLTSLLLFFFNSLLLLLFGDPVSLLFHDELMDATLVDMQLIVATVLLSVDFPDFFFNNRTALLHSHWWILFDMSVLESGILCVISHLLIYLPLHLLDFQHDWGVPICCRGCLVSGRGAWEKLFNAGFWPFFVRWGRFLILYAECLHPFGLVAVITVAQKTSLTAPIPLILGT